MKLYGFRYSPYVRKVQMLLDLAGLEYTAIEVPYSDRTELAKTTGGYVQVPVLVDDRGTVVCDSRRICEHLLVGELAQSFAPSPLEGPIWAYSDWADTSLEDVMFRIASPYSRDRWTSPGDRALYVFIKERKFGPGCVDQWQRDREDLIARGQTMLAQTARTLSTAPFLFGPAPTLADAALYGELAMLAQVEPSLLSRFQPELQAWMRRLEEIAASSTRSRQV